MNDDQVYLCKDCAHCKFNIFDRIMKLTPAYKCEVNKITRMHPVTGQVMVSGIVSCNHSRANYCGEEGRYWAPKNKKDIFRYLSKPTPTTSPVEYKYVQPKTN